MTPTMRQHPRKGSKTRRTAIERSTVEVTGSNGARTFRFSGWRSFDYRVVHVSKGVFDPSESALASFVEKQCVLVAIDRRVDELYGDALRGYMKAHRIEVAAYVPLRGDEKHKSWKQVEVVCRAAMACEFPRDGVIVGVGGGVVMDISGFAAAIYRRGVPHLRVPTTLIGIIDAGIGVKEAINAAGLKNVVGTYHPPIGVVSDLRVLATLDRADVLGGVAEMLKVGLVRDGSLVETLRHYGAALVTSRFQQPRAIAYRVVNRAIQLLMEELAGNAFEHDPRRLLDFGHSLSPSIEAASGFRISHGAAVAVELLMAMAIAVRRGLSTHADLDTLTALYVDVGLPVHQTVSRVPDLLAALTHVRRNRHGALNFVVPRGFGTGEYLQDVDADDLQFAWEYGRRTDARLRLEQRRVCARS